MIGLLDECTKGTQLFFLISSELLNTFYAIKYFLNINFKIQIQLTFTTLLSNFGTGLAALWLRLDCEFIWLLESLRCEADLSHFLKLPFRLAAAAAAEAALELLGCD